MKALKLWDKVLTTYISKNDSVKGALQKSPFYADLKALYSGDSNVSFLYTIDGYPKELNINYREFMRGMLREGVRISFVSTFEGHKIQWDSPQMKAKMRTWQTLDKEAADLTEYNYYSAIGSVDSQNRRKESLVYLGDADKMRGRKFYRYRTLVVVSGKRGENFDGSVTDLLDYCKMTGLKMTRVLFTLQDYLKVFSPFILGVHPKVLDGVGNTVLPDEMLARFATYSQGVVGKRGIYWGTDIFSGFPCLKPIKPTAESAENWLITAEVGGGKSFFVKVLLLQLAADRRYNGTIMDVEGFEYVPFAKFMVVDNRVEVVNMAEGQGAYFDPVEIMLTDDKETNNGMYSLSASFTTAVFKTLLGDVESGGWEDIVLGDAVSLTYKKRGVVPELTETWHKSKGLTLYDVYDSLKSLAVSNGGVGLDNFKSSVTMQKEGAGGLTQNDVSRLVSSNTDYQKALVTCLGKVSRYFERSGTRSGLFRNRIDTKKVINAKLVVCSFGMAGKSEANVDKTQMALMQLCAANISYLRSVFSKQSGKFNFKLWEEFQRWGGFPDADKTIGTALTGGRKLGDINIIITNKVGELLENDRFGIFSNVQSVALGSIGDSKVRKELCERLSISQMLPELNRIAEENKDLSEYIAGDTLSVSTYRHAFLIGLDKTVYAVSRMSVPKVLANCDIFRTGVSLED